MALVATESGFGLKINVRLLTFPHGVLGFRFSYAFSCMLVFIKKLNVDSDRNIIRHSSHCSTCLLRERS